MKHPIEKIKDDLYVKKSLGEWVIVYPIQKDLNKPFGKGNINWKNLLIGRWKSFITTIIVLGIIFFLLFTYINDTKMCRETLLSPCVVNCRQFEINFSEINFSKFEVNKYESKYPEGFYRE